MPYILQLCQEHRLLTNRLIKQGFWYTKLCMIFKKFTKKHNVLFSKYDIGVRQHIIDGICTPLEVKGDLARNVTTRSPTVCHLTALDHMML